AVEERVRGEAAGVIPVAAERELALGVPVTRRSQLLAGNLETMAEPHVPIEPRGLRVFDVFPLTVIAPLACGVVAAIAGVHHHQPADAVFLDQLTNAIVT